MIAVAFCHTMEQSIKRVEHDIVLKMSACVWGRVSREERGRLTNLSTGWFA